MVNYGLPFSETYDMCTSETLSEALSLVKQAPDGLPSVHVASS
jgi:hypothetical protein